MSLQTRLSALITAIGSDIKSLTATVNTKVTVVRQNADGSWPARPTSNVVFWDWWVAGSSAPVNGGVGVSVGPDKIMKASTV